VSAAIQSAAAASGELAISTRELRKDFGARTAVRNLSIEVRRGEIFGFLGPNGAGKSTSIKMLLGLVKPTGGAAQVLGEAPGNVEIRRRIGFLPEDFRFYEWMNPAELLFFHGRLSGVPSGILRTRVPAYLEMVGLAPHRTKRLEEFSKGMLQRVGFAQALIHEPDLIFLDEPTSGLDPMGRRLVRDIIRAQRDRGATVFLNSHLLSEIEITCDRVAFIKDGALVQTRDLRTMPESGIRVVVRGRKISAQTLQLLKRITEDVTLDGEQLVFAAPAGDRLPEILSALVASGAEIYQFTPETISLEDLFMRLVGEDRGL
jgi:ABC-2 type transport system ATP-binding protein